jgi:hypothetical protein
VALDIQVTFDVHDLEVMSRFWALALDYEDEPPPPGFSSWEDFAERNQIPSQLWRAAVVDPERERPVQIGESTQIFRMHYDGSTPKVKIITIEDLKGEAAKARAGYEAAQAVGRALDDDQPTVLGELNPLAKAMLIGRM